MNPPTPVLLVESDRHFALALARELSADGYRVTIANDLDQVSGRASSDRARIILLGRLPGRQAQGLVERTRAEGALPDGRRGAPAVLVIGAEAGGLEALRAFESGADDFLARPFNYLELRARMKALLERIPPLAESGLLELDALRLDMQTRGVAVEGSALALTRLEFELLARLAGAPHRIFTRDELLASIWGFRSAGATRTVDTHASRLRAKLDAVSDRHWITAVRGVGYRLI